MYSEQYLEIAGNQDRPVPNQFFVQDDVSRHLAILLPGLIYPTDMPLMYYPVEQLLYGKADVLCVQYAYSRDEEYKKNSPAERTNRLFEDCTAAYKVGMAQRAYEHILLIGKSLGTLAMGHLLDTQPGLHNAHCLWLTPLLRIESLYNQIIHEKRAGMFVIGTEDGHYDADLLEKAIKATDGQSVVIEGAEHSMEFPGDLQRSLMALQQIMQSVEGFLQTWLTA
ncbi:MAG: hypothetical protein OEZ02_15900 [Anaerolineae bacterium]|nr:hypothetical protein [Anaerolineae bacterium]